MDTQRCTGFLYWDSGTCRGHVRVWTMNLGGPDVTAIRQTGLAYCSRVKKDGATRSTPDDVMPSQPGAVTENRRTSGAVFRAPAAQFPLSWRDGNRRDAICTGSKNREQSHWLTPTRNASLAWAARTPPMHEGRELPPGLRTMRAFQVYGVRYSRG